LPLYATRRKEFPRRQFFDYHLLRFHIVLDTNAFPTDNNSERFLFSHKSSIKGLLFSAGSAGNKSKKGHFHNFRLLGAIKYILPPKYQLRFNLLAAKQRAILFQ
jgi:hypothetical protein